MTSVETNNSKRGYSWIGILLFAIALSLLGAAPAQAEDCVKDLGGLLDGFVRPVPPSQIQIDGNCTIRNYPASNPMSTNFSFLTQPGQNRQRWLVVFDNVVHTGQMSCNAVQGHKIWFTNGSSTGIHQNCQNLLIPVEKINKQNPAGQTTATIGVPFTYTLTIPVLFDPNNEVTKLYKVQTMPSTVLVARDGTMRFIHHGYKPGYEGEYQTQVRALLRE